MTTQPFNHILGAKVSTTTYHDATRQIIAWAANKESRSVCVANVHLVMEAHDDPDYRTIINAADLVTPDDMLLVWVLRRKGHDLKDRVYGPTLTLWVLEAAAQEGIPVGFYGASPDVLAALLTNIRQKFPNLNIAYSHSPPFRKLTPDEDATIVRDINASGAQILFVGLGCPKQETWMFEHSSQFSVVRGRCEDTENNAGMLGCGNAEIDTNAGMLECWNK